MAKAMLINVTHAEESRVAIVENGVLDTFEIETLNRESIKGNVYNGVVEGINTTLNAAFVRYGNDRPGFLPMDEINFKNVPLLRGRDDNGHRHQIRDRLDRGQRILVQVIKDGFSTKPASLTTYYSLPGRYLVLMPGSDSSGISRKIEDAEQRERLRKIVEELEPPEGFGLIVRTAGFDVSRAELQRDLKYLLKLWETVVKTANDQPAPSMVYQERDLVIRTIRDYFTHDIGEIFIDSKEMFEKARLFFQEVMPSRRKILKLYTEDRPIFTRYNLEEQIESIYKRRVLLRSGGEIVIDGTEALTAIDVNSAKSRRESNIEELATATNLEAAEEIARQLRIRDIGGLIVIDFIDMRSQKNVREVERALKEAMKRDKAKYDVTRISKLGLMEISRQRLKSQKAAGSYVSCPVCGGHGLVRTTESAALAVLRKIHARVPRGDLSAVKVELPPEVAIYLLNNKREDLAGLERRYKTKISVVPTPGMRPHQSEIELLTKEGEAGRFEEPKVVHAHERRPARSDRPVLQLAAPAAEAAAPAPSPEKEPGEPVPAASPATAPAEGEVRKRRRRRRRRRSRHGHDRQDAATGPAPPAEGQVSEPEPPEATIRFREDSGGAGRSGHTAAPESAEDTPAEPRPEASAASGDEDKPLKRARRLWWRKRNLRSKAPAAGSGGTGGEDAT
ncbi:MAG TPA: Rne/Rng family ribonuclease [Candidatus Polarisedimenticolia bacterium]|jgi:ribonuclease E|nr:Rne/Rng family ribonuclease [Candidatus Polarisedimenticolia bacterium]